MAADLEARVNQLEATVRKLQDREAIRELRYRYHEYVNESKGNDIPGLFTDDGELDFGHLGKAKGKEQLQKFFRALDASETAPDRPRITWVKQFILPGCCALRRRIRQAKRSVEIPQDESRALLYGAVQRGMGAGGPPQDAPALVRETPRNDALRDGRSSGAVVR